MKKLAGLLCALALLCSFCLPAFADNNDNMVKITTTVPSTHTLTVTKADGAAVICNGQPGTTFTVERLSQPRLLVRPDSGRVLSRVTLNGADITALVQGGYYTLPAVYEDLTLQVETTAATPISGKKYIVQGTVTRSGAAAPGITLELRSSLKTCVTGSDGTFRFDEVETGRHSLTALENGKVVGYMVFYLTEGTTTQLSVSNGAQVVYVDKTGIGVELALQLQDDETLTPQQAATVFAPATPQPTPTAAPQPTAPAETSAPANPEATPASTPAPAQSATTPARIPAPAQSAAPTETPQPTTPTGTPAPAAPEETPTETPQPTAPAVTPAQQTARVTPLVWLIPLVLFILVLLVLLRRKKDKE